MTEPLTPDQLELLRSLPRELATMAERKAVRELWPFAGINGDGLAGDIRPTGERLLATIDAAVAAERERISDELLRALANSFTEPRQPITKESPKDGHGEDGKD
jgi:hypothetical protein